MSGTNILADEIADRIIERMRERHVEQRVYTSTQAAKYLGVSSEAMRQMAINLVVPHVRIDSTYRFDKKDLDLFVDTHKKVR